MSYQTTYKYYPNNPNGEGWSGTTVCLNPNDGNSPNSGYLVLKDTAYSSADLNTVSVDDSNYVQASLSCNYSSGANCCGFAENQGETDCSVYSESSCPYYLIYAPATGLFSKCSWIAGPDICVPMYPCKTYGGHEWWVGLYPDYATSITITVKAASSVSFSPQVAGFYLYIWNDTTNRYETLDTHNVTGTSSVTFSGTISSNLSDYIWADNTINLMIMGNVVGGKDYQMRVFFVEVSVTYNIPDPKIEILGGQLQSGEIR